MCTREELEAHFQAAKEYFQLRSEIAVLRNQGIGAGQAYRQIVGSRNDPLMLRYYAPSLYAHAMTIPLEPAETEEISPLQKPPAQEPQEEAPGIVASLPFGEASEQAEPEVLHHSPSPVGLLPAAIEYEDQSHTDTFSVSAESDQIQPGRLAIQFSQDETLEVTSQMFDYLLRQAVQEFEQVNKKET